MLLSLPPRLIRRLKSHFHHFPPPCGPTGVDVILGLNGFVWVSMGTTQEVREGGDGFDAEGVYSDKNDEITPESRLAISCIASIITALAECEVPLTDTLIADGFKWLSEDNRGQLRPLGPQDQARSKRMVESVTGVSVE